MNLLLFAAEELDGDRLQLADRRKRHLCETLRLRVGDRVRVGQINGSRGSGTVTRIRHDLVELKIVLDQPPPPPSRVDLILALPRPIMVQRILKQATALGVRHIYFIRSRKVERSYFQTHVLRSEKINRFVLEGLSQAMDTRVPKISVHPLFKPFLEDIVPSLPGFRLLAHPGVSATLPAVYQERSDDDNLVLAIGPEGGWNEYEVDRFLAMGFHPFTMGPRILHVDTTVVALLAQVHLLYDFFRR